MLFHRCIRLSKPTGLTSLASRCPIQVSPLRNTFSQPYVHHFCIASFQADSRRQLSSQAISFIALQRPSTVSTIRPLPVSSLHNALSQTRTFASSAAVGAPRNTTNRMTHLIRKRRHGYLARLRSKSGRRILKRRMVKGRKNLSH